MTQIVLFVKNEKIVGYECSGHSNYAENGADIVCSAVSSLTQGIAMGLEKILEINLNLQIDEKKAYLKCKLPKNISAEKLEQSQILLKTLKVALEDIYSQNKKYISLKIREEV